MASSSPKPVLLPSSLLDQLIENLQKSTPNSLPVLATVHHIITGKLKGHSAEVYTNGWPEFSAVVCQYNDMIFQKFLCCYTSKAEDLVCLLNEAKLIESGQKWILLVEDSVVDMLFRNPTFGEDARKSKIFTSYYLPQSLDLNNYTCPDRFVLRKLEEHHAETISLYWPFSSNLSAKHSFFNSLIKHYQSVGLFSQEEPDEPIAWCVQYPFGQCGNLYVTEKYRRRGFACLLMEQICKSIRADGLLPYVGVFDGNDNSTKLMQKIGFVEHAKFRYVSSKILAENINNLFYV